MSSNTDEETPLLRSSVPDDNPKDDRKPTPLPKGQIAVLLLLQLAEPISSMSIVPYINQVSFGVRGVNKDV